MFRVNMTDDFLSKYYLLLINDWLHFLAKRERLKDVQALLTATAALGSNYIREIKQIRVRAKSEMMQSYAERCNMLGSAHPPDIRF